MRGHCGPRRAPVMWPIRHNTRDDVNATTTRDENHKVSRVGVGGCGSYDERGCYEARANAVPPDQASA